jgi:hypothetical protein
LPRRQTLQKEGGKLRGGEPTAYYRKFHRIRLESRESRKQLIDLQNKFNLKILESWRNEVEVHGKGLYQNYTVDNASSCEQLTKELFEYHISDIGFTLDKKLSNKTLIVYSKPIHNSWKLFFAIERKLLIEYIGNRFAVSDSNNSEGRLSRPLCPRFEMVFGVANNKTRRALTFENEQALLLKFDWFMPIRKAPLWSDYSSYYTLRELETLINIHFTFYHLVVRDIEQAVINRLKS